MKPPAELLEALRGKRLLIFDFDGTIADTTPLHAAAFSQALAPLGIAVHYPDIAGRKTADALRHCLTGAGREFTEADVMALTAEKQRRVRQMIARSLKPLPGVHDFLQWAKSRYRLAMYTSGSRGTVSLALDKLGYTGWFDPLICADDVACAKPDPEGFLTVLRLTGISASEALVFEDSDVGFLAASVAGLAYFDVRTVMWSE